MKAIKKSLSAALAAVTAASSLSAAAAPHSNGAYDVGEGILISSTDFSADGVAALSSKNVQYDTSSKKKGTAVFTQSDDKTVKAVTDVFGSSYTYEGVIDYVGSGKGKNAFVIPVTIASEDNYFVYVLTAAAGTINMWLDNTDAKISANTPGARQAAFAVEGTGGVAYAIDCGTISAGSHTITLDGASGAWCPDICAVAIRPDSADDFRLPYQNESLSFEERAADLVSRMTAEEKTAQLGHNAPAIPRLGVNSYYYWREGAHGVARQGKATSFPSSIAMSNTWDPALYEQAADITSTEARIKNSRYDLNYWSPTINMSRDPRWGRNEESLGEDTLLTSEMGSAFVRGLQGSDDKYIKTIATVKHFLANNCEGERQTGTSEMTESELRGYYARAFQNIVEGTDPGAVMSSYNATTVTRNGEKLWDYLAMPANENILTGYLRRGWGFSGFVTGDCGAVADLNGNAFKRALFNYHEDSRPLSSIDQSQTVALSVQAGNEMDCGAINTSYGLDALNKGYMDEDDLDIAVYRIFLERFKTGEFDDTTVYRTYSANDLETDENVAVAEKAAEESIVLLENKDSFLPIEGKKNIALVGEMASQIYLGDYSGSPEKTVSPYEGLVRVFGKENVNFLGHVDDDTEIMNIKNLRFVDNKGNETAIDLSGAEVSGAQLSGGALIGVTPAMQLKLASVDFSKVVKVRADIEVPSGSLGGTVSICYGSATLVEANIEASAGNGYVTCEGDYTGADGGYNGKTDMYMTVTARSGFDVDAYASALEEADVIIAYSSTMASSTKDPDGQLTDCKESNDRTSINLPYRDRGNIEKLCDRYGSKVAVVMQSAGEMDVAGIKDKCRALLWTGYNGQSQGEALAKILSGEVNPSGRLSTTWYDPKDLNTMKVNGTSTNDTDTNGTTKITWKRNDYSLAPKSASDNWPGRTYMYYRGEPIYPFGYGLSYTSFAYSFSGSASLSEADEDCVKITAEYDGGRLVSVMSEPAKRSQITADAGDAQHKIMYWNSLSGMQPVTAPEVTTAPTESPSGVVFNANAGDILEVPVTVKNTGKRDGAEVIELYMSHSDADGITMPLRKLVGFERTELKAGEEKTVSIKVDTNALAAWSETELKNIIPTGRYALYAGRNADDKAAEAVVDVTGALPTTIKTVYAVPTGVKLTGAYDKASNTTEAISTIVPQLSVVLSDDSVLDLSKAAVEYSSANEKIATAGADGTVRAGTEEGVTMITARVTANGSTGSYSFPVVTYLQNAIPARVRADYLSQLDSAYGAYSESDYRADFWQRLTKIYTDAKTALETEVDAARLDGILNDAMTAMAEVRDHLKDGEDAYTVTLTPDWYRNAQISVKYNGDEDEPQGMLVTEINGEREEHECTASMTEDFSYTLSSLSYGDNVKAYIEIGSDTVSNAAEDNIAKPPAHVEYDLSDAKYGRLSALAAGEKFDEINGVGGYGALNDISNVSYSVSCNGKTYSLTGGFQGGKGSFTQASVYFIPFDCYKKATITVFFDSAEEARQMRIAQNDGTKNGIELGRMGGAGNRKIQTLTVTTEDMTKPVFIQPQTKESFYMIVVDYEGEADE